VLDRMMLFPATLSDSNYPQITPFSTFCIAFRIFAVSRVTSFKFDRYYDGREFQPTDGKASLKGSRLGHVNHLNFGGHQPLSLERLQVELSRQSSQVLST